MKGILLYLSILVTCILQSCSFIRTVGSFKPDRSSEWKPVRPGYHYRSIPFATPNYTIEKDSFSLTITPAPQQSYAMSFGPPLIPIIPNPMLLMRLIKKQKTTKFNHFFIDVLIINTKHSSIPIDLSQIKFYNKHRKLSESSIYYINNTDLGKPTEYLKNKLEANSESALNNVLIKSSDSLVVRYDFNDLPTNKVKLLNIQLNEFYEDLSPSALTLKKKTKWFYIPLYDE